MRRDRRRKVAATQGAPGLFGQLHRSGDIEKTGRRTAWTNLKPHGSGTLRTVALVGRLILIDVNPCVDTTTVELKPEKPAAGCVAATAANDGVIAR